MARSDGLPRVRDPFRSYSSNMRGSKKMTDNSITLTCVNELGLVTYKKWTEILQHGSQEDKDLLAQFVELNPELKRENRGRALAR